MIQNYDLGLMINFKQESNVRYYSNIFPAIFSKAKDSHIFDNKDKKYIDFFSGAGTLNYGHNNDLFKEKLINYIKEDRIIHSLDMMTEAKMEMLKNFQNIILGPRNLNYKIQFTGPTGTDAIEAALKLARKYTKRKDIIYFTNSYHGMSMGSLSITPKKKRIGIPVGHTIEMPFFKENSSTNLALNEYFASITNEEDYPAAIVLETIQAEGGINIANIDWLKNIEKLSNKHKVLLIVDDIQVGIGRSGDFFSFERANIKPDIICLSKSLSGYGLPLSVALIKPEFDIWSSGEHSGTFRGFNLAFIAGNEALIQYWSNNNFSNHIKMISSIFHNKLLKITEKKGFVLRGIGMIYGIDTGTQQNAENLRRYCFENGLIFENCGPNKSIIKMIPPLTINEQDLESGLDIFSNSISRL